jgi:hypothetical protein
MGIMSPKQPPENQNDRPDGRPPAVPMSDQELLRHRWRYKEARRMNFTWREAKLFASSDMDIEEMRSLARRGCSPDLILHIL